MSGKGFKSRDSEKLKEQTEPALLLAKVQAKETEIERLQKKLKEAEDSLAIFKKAEKQKKAA